MNEPFLFRRVLRLLRLFCPDHLSEEISGDLIQRFEKDVKTVGVAKAKRRLIWNAIRFFRPGIILRNKFSSEFQANSMITNYFKMAMRHLIRKKAYSVIEVGGLAVGMAAFFLIVMYASFELGFDRFHKNADQIYRVAYLKYENGSVVNSSTKNYFGLGPFLKENFGEVVDVVRFYRWPANTGAVLMAGEKIFNERRYFFAEDSFFKVFPSLLEQGDPVKCLQGHNSVVLSRSLALKMFGTTDALGKVVSRLDLKDSHLTVTGIMRDTPEQSHFSVDVLIPYDEDWITPLEDRWKYANELTYITLKPGVNSADLQDKLNAALSTVQKDNPDYAGASMLLQRVSDIHLHSNLKDEIEANGNHAFVYGIGIAGLVILLISWINYVNLEISQFLGKAREVGIRRIIGSSRGQILLQFLIQFVCIFTLALVLSSILIFFLKPYYFILTGISDLPEVALTWEWLLVGIFFVVGSIIAGVYPALFVIRFNPVHALKGYLGKFQGALLKKGLVTFQFAASIILLAFILIVYRQLEFMRSIQRNMDTEHVLTVYNSTSYTVFEDSLRKEKTLAFREKLLQHAEFENVTASSVVPGDPIGFTYHNLTKRSLTDPDDGVPYKVLFVDYAYIPVFGLKLKAGRNYSEERGEDKNHDTLILNESAVRALGFKSAEEALGQDVYFMVTFDWKKYKIAGIVEDYRHESAKTPMLPTIFFLHNYVGQMTYYSMRMSAKADPSVALKVAETAWAEIWPGKPFDYFFADQHYDQQYKSEIYFGRISFVFAAVAIFLACLGVVGISLFETNARLREVGIRKVLGASITNIVSLLSQSNMRMIVLSAVMSIPVIWFMANRWLASYPVRIDVSLYYFLIPFAAILFLVLFASGFQILKAANANPVNHLKNE